MNHQTKLQVTKDHYHTGYDLGDRFASYQEQLKLITNIKPNRLLEIGAGNKFTKTYLQNHNYHIETVDIDKELEPDYLLDIRDLHRIKNKKFDLVCAFQVLEHLPFIEFERLIQNMKSLAKTHVLISLPYANATFSLKMRIRLGAKINIDRTSLITIPAFFHNIDIKKNKQHYWEVGARNHSRKRIRTILTKHLHIEKEYVLKSNPYHIFYIMKINKDKAK